MAAFTGSCKFAACEERRQINKTQHPEENNPVIDELFEQAARNHGFGSLEEFAEVSSWLDVVEQGAI